MGDGRLWRIHLITGYTNSQEKLLLRELLLIR